MLEDSGIVLLDSRGSVIHVSTPHAKYRALADELRRRIAAGLLPPGAPLPSETALINESGLSRGMVREAIKLLRDEGLVITEQGRGSYVRPILPVRRIGSDRYRADVEQLGDAIPPATSFTRDQHIPWSDFRLDREFAEVPATPTLAEMFGVEPGTMLLERRFVFHAAGQPQQMSVTNYLLDMVAGTPIADPANEPWPGGNINQLRTLGLVVTGVRERVRARRAMTDECETLRIGVGDPVITITRLTYVGERVVEVAHDIVIPADRVELDYWIDLTS